MRRSVNMGVTLKILFAVSVLGCARTEALPDSLLTLGISRLGKFLPAQILAGPEFGFTSSRFAASSAYQTLIEPTGSPRQPWATPNYGALLTARWKSGISLELAPRHESYSIESSERTVAFPNNPFPHTLKASTEMSYNVWPLLLGMGWYGTHQNFKVQIGAYAAYLDDFSINWTVDGEPYSNLPSTQIRSTQSGWMLGCEYGVHFGPGEIILGVDTQRGNHSLMGGMEGSIKVESQRLHLGYEWTLMRR